jgi:tripartite-type tricarboxylate transporter receptor subunit TctC
VAGFVFLAVTMAVIATARPASAEETYPIRPIRLIVPFPPGGPTDVMGRLISQGLSDQLGQQVYVDNRPGAGSTLAAKIAANAEPDGYTLLLGSAATQAIGPTLYRDAEYDPKRFEPVAMVAEVPYVMVASPKAPIANFAELIAYAKAHPGKLNFGVPNGAPPHMLAAWFKSLTNIDVVLVTYRGGANVLSDLLGGQIDLAVETCSILLPQLREGKLRPLGTPSPQRLDVLYGGERCAGFHRQFLDRHCRAAGHAQADYRQAQPRDQCRACASCHASQAQTAGSPSHVRHAGRLR